jgi:hypothetical protein
MNLRNVGGARDDPVRFWTLPRHAEYFERGWPQPLSVHPKMFLTLQVVTMLDLSARV